MAPSGVLLRARWNMLKNRLLRQSPARKLTLLFSTLATLLGAALGGYVVAPSLQKAAEIAPLPGESVPAGGPYVNLGFWIAALGVAVLSFRVMEGIYRKQDARLLSTWPIPLGSQFVYRLLTTGAEVGIGSVLLAAFFVPIVLVSGDPRAWMGLGLGLFGLWTSLAVGFAIQLYAGVSTFKGEGGALKGTPAERLGRMDAGGGTAAAFYFSPGAALIASLVLLLWTKLAVADEFFARGLTRLFYMGVGLPLVVSLVSLAVARSYFVRYYPMLLARFYESDLVQFDSGYKYHESASQDRRSLVERFVPGELLPLYRKDSLQLSRRYPLLKGLMVMLWIIVGVLSYGQSLPAWALAALPAVYIATLAAPHARLYGKELEPGMHRQLPLKPEHVRKARLFAVWREGIVAALPCAVLMVALGGVSSHILPALCALFLPLLLLPLLLEVAHRAGSAPGWFAGATASAVLSLALLQL